MFTLKTKHFLTGTELSNREMMDLLFQAETLREQRLAGARRKDLDGKTVLLLFEKPSMRTRVSFASAVQELGGFVQVLESSNRKTEEPQDTIRVLGGYAHGVMVRTYSQTVLESMVSKSTIPVINGLSDSHHPCQALADLLTLHQTYKDLKGLKLTYIGDGNNVLHSLLLLAPPLGVEVHYACPQGYAPNSLIVRQAVSRAKGKGSIVAHEDPVKAIEGSQAVYTDVWTSMGQEQEAADRNRVFADYQLNSDLYGHASPGALIMHCMPMVREKEITSALVEHENSAIFRQSENRMHAQKALLVGLLCK